MPNRKARMARNRQKRLPFTKRSHRSQSNFQNLDVSDNNNTQRSCASVRDLERVSLLNPNNQIPRRTSSACSSRISREQSMTTSETSSHMLQDQIRSLSELTLSTIEQLDISTERKTRECVVCVTDKFLDQFDGIFGDTCVHIERTVCNSCVYKNTKCLIEDSMLYFGEVTCPEPNCDGKFDYNGIQQILLFIGKNKQLFEEYDLHLMYRQLEHTPEFLWCAYNCGSGQLYEGESGNPVVTCKKCNRPTCFKHRVVWHTDMSCDQYDLLNNQPSQTDATNKWLEMFAKQCPQCHWHIQKYEGCDHMTCRQCKHEFCWICFVDYKLIASKGASQHKTTCSHYQPEAPATTGAI